MTAQFWFYILSPIGTLLAIYVAYIALIKQAQPHITIYYEPDDRQASVINLVVENAGGGTARDITFSQPLPVACFGIEKPDCSGDEVLGTGLPAIAAGQRYIYMGGQYAGLDDKLGDGLNVKVVYSYNNPIGITRKRVESCVLHVKHLALMPSVKSMEQAVVDALGQTNQTTIHQIRDRLSSINKSLEVLAKATEKQEAVQESDTQSEAVKSSGESHESI